MECLCGFIPGLVALSSRPACFELGRLESREHVCFGVENNLCQREIFPRREKEVEILQSLGLREC